MTPDDLHARWLALASRLGCTGDAEAAFELLQRHYGRPGRAYHNLGHVGACLCVLDEVRDYAEDADAVEAAIWFHDLVYVPGDPENETRSAGLAVDTLCNLNPQRDLTRAVHDLILATAHRGPAHRPDERLIADIDLVILAASDTRYRAYAAAIEEEAGLPPAEFARRRLAFLEAMLAHPFTFQTHLFRGRHEAAARANLRAERERLAAI